MASAHSGINGVTGHGAPLSPKHILYVEDNVVNQALMTEMVSRCTSHHLQVAATFHEGLRLASHQRFDLLLLDLRLPDGDGAELLGLLRRLPACAKVPAVAVTAEYGFQLEGSTFCEVWYKPLDLHQTLERLDRVLRRPPAPAQAATGTAQASLPPRWALAPAMAR
jgi:CheY-like chemotaxis protein